MNQEVRKFCRNFMLEKNSIKKFNGEHYLKATDTIQHAKLAMAELQKVVQEAENMKEAVMDDIFQNYLASHLDHWMLCPVSGRIMKNPIIIETNVTMDFHSFESWCVYCRSKNEPVSCPVTKKFLMTTHYWENGEYKQDINQFIEKKKVDFFSTLPSKDNICFEEFFVNP